MTSNRLRGLAAGGACLTVAVAAWLAAGGVRTEDRNRDGRPDVWRSYDRFGQVQSVGLDTNFDGLLDVVEFYQRGALVRRELDRNYDRTIDLVQQYDARTGALLRSVADLDDDGVADLLELYRDGHPVRLRRTTSGRQHAAAAAAALRHRQPPRGPRAPAALVDPFSDDAAMAGQVPDPRVPVFVASAGASLPVDARGDPGARPDTVGMCRTDLPLPASSPLDAASPRGPPFLPLG